MRIYYVDTSEDDCKEMSITNLRNLMDFIQPEAIVTVMECWAIRESAARYAMDEGLRPSMMPQRESTVLFTLETSEGTQAVMAPLIEGKDGKQSLGKLDFVKGDKFRGGLSNLMSKPSEPDPSSAIMDILSEAASVMDGETLAKALQAMEKQMGPNFPKISLQDLERLFKIVAEREED